MASINRVQDASGAVLSTTYVSDGGQPITKATFDAAVANVATLQARAQAALAANDTFLATVAARRTAIASGKTTAQTGTNATVGSLAAAQVQVRSLWTVLIQIATALDDMNNVAEQLAKESNAIIRLALGLLDDITDTA